MNRENYRTVGAILGLAVGILLMVAVGLNGLIAGAIFGAGGCVLGGISGEKLYDRGRS